VNVTRVLVFCLSAFLAAIAGVLNGATAGVVSATSYSSLLSVTFFAVVVISVGREPWYAIFAAAGYTLIPLVWSSGDATNWLTLLFGVFAVLTVFTSGRDTAPRLLTSGIDRIFRHRVRTTPLIDVGASSSPASRTQPEQSRPAARPDKQPVVLEVDGIVVRFGGLVAVNDVSLAAPIGRITGLIGPNGAGKSTTLNACSGLVRPSTGGVRFLGRSISHRGSSARARMGMGRTFQQMQLFDDMTVHANVALGSEGGLAGNNPISHMLPAWGDRTRVDQAASAAMQLCGLDAIADRMAGTLSTGQRRLVELARCLAGPYQILLLDEPSSGLDRQETERFGALLQQVVRERDIGILLIEHDMTLVSSICDYVYVLDFGEGIFSGTAQEVLAAPVVQQAYLGIEVPDAARSAATIGGAR
jgi:ABC-type branched-subunit amino acid transport system ATPase component